MVEVRSAFKTLKVRNPVEKFFFRAANWISHGGKNILTTELS